MNIPNLMKKSKVYSLDEMEEFIDEIDKVKYLEPRVNATVKPMGPQGHKGIANGMKFDSYWEWAFYLYMTEKEGKIVERNRTENFPYTDDDGKLRKFYPDFIVNGIYYEVKGWLRPKDQCKMDQCPNVHFVFGDEIKPMTAWLYKHHPNWKSEYQETI